MSKISLIALNIVDNNILLNPSKTPILFYWNGEDTIKESMLTNDFKEILKSVCDKEHYSSSIISYATFLDANTENQGDEEYSSGEIKVQDVIFLSENNELAYNIIYLTLHELYINSFKKSYNYNSNISLKDNIQNMYRSILNTFGDKLISKSIFHYVKSKLEKHNYNEQNLNELIRLSKDLLGIT